jgi:hypothetical protein
MLVRYYLGCFLPLMFLVIVLFDISILLIVPALLFFVGVPLLDPLFG